jgi:alkyl hydroperoxide reductase subunit AhpC
LQQHHDTFDALDVRILVVTFESAPQARAYADEMRLPFPVLIDETRTMYGAYGMHRGGLMAIWGPRTWWAYAKELARGQRPIVRKDYGDMHQLGGDVLIDPDGIVRLVYVGSGPADRPTIEALLAARRAHRPDARAGEPDTRQP